MRLALALALALAAGPGCRGTPPTVDDDPEIQALDRDLAGRRPPGKVLAIAPVELAYAPTADLEQESSRYPARVDKDALREAMAAAIAKHAGFGEPVLAGKADLDQAFEEAFAAKADVLLRPVLTRFECAYRERNWRYAPNLFLFFYLWVPSFWVADETYAIEGEVVWEAYSVASERLLYARSAPLDETWPLDDFERGWSWTGIITAPKTLDEDDWAKVSESMAPLMQVEGARASAIEAGRGLTTYVQGDEFRARDQTVFALSVGVSRHQDGTLGPEGAGGEAERLATTLHARLGVPRKNIVTLADQRATREAVERAFAEHLGRARPADTVVIAWSGLGVAAPPAPRGAARGADDQSPGLEPERVLLPFDADPARLAESALSLARLRELIATLKSQRVLVVLDASFGEGRRPGTRSLARAGGGRPGALDAALKAFSERRDGKDVSLFLASGPGEDAMDLAAAKRGLFGFLFEEAVGGAADADKDGVVSAGELIGYLDREVSAQAGLEGVEQRPALYRLGRRVALGELFAQGAWLPNAGSRARAPKGAALGSESPGTPR